MFAQAIRKTSATAPSRTRSAVRNPETRLSASGTIRMPHPSFSFGYWRSSAADTAASSACACSRVRPSARRPTTVR